MIPPSNNFSISVSYFCSDCCPLFSYLESYTHTCVQICVHVGWLETYLSELFMYYVYSCLHSLLQGDVTGLQDRMSAWEEGRLSPAVSFLKCMDYNTSNKSPPAQYDPLTLQRGLHLCVCVSQHVSVSS